MLWRWLTFGGGFVAGIYATLGVIGLVGLLRAIFRPSREPSRPTRAPPSTVQPWVRQRRIAELIEQAEFYRKLGLLDEAREYLDEARRLNLS